MGTFLVLIFLVGLVVAIVGIVMLIIDYAKDRSKRKALIVIVSGVVLSLVCFAGIGAYNHHVAVVETRKEAAMNKRFKKEISLYDVYYYEAANKAEDVGNSIRDGWMDAIDNSGSADDFDVESTVDDLTNQNSDDISDIETTMNNMSRVVQTMKKNDTGKYDYAKYKSGYDKLKKLTNLVSYPSGSYSTFSSDFSDEDTNTADFYRELTD